MNDVPDPRLRRRDTLYLTAGITIWLGVGFSLGWYYTFTYYGRAGWPMPLPETCAALVLYYFSVLNVDTEWQALHWMLVFPAAAALWVECLRRCARWMGYAQPPFRTVFLLFGLATLPLALPGPWMAWIAGIQDGAFHVDRMLAVALRRGFVTPWSWLSPMYAGLGTLGLFLQLTAYKRNFRMPGAKAWMHYPLSMLALVATSAVSAAIAALPLRLWFE
ncbi:MAG: hypothetical protein IT364_27020 [Candidatus Hydrogenedentes bacterium]|nr:hypothetical protein [Candidatus Hydrogenedentota bacterium]